jgi:hypothetical protein
MSSSWRYPFPEASRRGWAFLPGTALDAFGRWDAHWYLDLAARGYELRGPLSSVQSNVAFFPLYPWAVGAVHALLPSAWRDEGSLYLCVIAVSNAAALLGLWLLWRLAREVTGEDDVASRTVLYAILFPTGFILSAPYPEALFLLLPVGVLVAVPLGWLAFTQGGTPEPGRAPRLCAARARPGPSRRAALADHRQPAGPLPRAVGLGALVSLVPVLLSRADAVVHPLRGGDLPGLPGAGHAGEGTPARSGVRDHLLICPGRPLPLLVAFLLGCLIKTGTEA